MARRAGTAFVLAALLLVSLLSLAASHGNDDAAAAGAPDFAFDDSEELAAEAHNALLHQTVRPYDPNIKVAATVSRDLLDLQASDPDTWASNVADGDEGPGEDQSNLPGAHTLNQKQVIFDATGAEQQPPNDAGQKWANEKAGPIDAPAQEKSGGPAGSSAGAVNSVAADEEGPDPVEHSFDIGAIEDQPDAPDFVPMYLRKAEVANAAVDDEPQLHEVAAAQKARARSHQQVRQALGQQQEQGQQGEQEAQAGDVTEEPELPAAARRLLTDPEDGAEAAATYDDADTPSVARRKLMASSVPYPGGSNQPGAFTSGDNPLQNKAGIASDNPHGALPYQPPAATPSSTDNTAGIDPNVLRSLNNDLQFTLRSANSGQPSRRRLLVDGEAAPAPAAGDAPVFRPLTQQDFMLPAAEAERAAAERASLIAALEASAGPTEAASIEIDPEAAAAAYDAAVAAVKAMGLYEKLRGETEDAAAPRKLISGEAAQEGSILPSAWPHATDVAQDDKPLYGINYSWRRAEECDSTKRVCQCPHHDVFEKDMGTLHRYTRRVRTYSVECPEIMRMMAHLSTAAPTTLSWMLGVWVGKDDKANQAQLSALERILTEFPRASYYAIAVGNEVLHRKDLTEEAHIDIIRQVRLLVKRVAKAQGSAELAAVPITTVDVPWAISAELAAELDVIAVNVHPFYSGLLDTTQKTWLKTAVGGALYHVNQLRKQYKNKPVLVAEIGWPTASGPADANIGSVANAKAFVQAWTKAAKQYEVPYFYHEAFDSAWKGKLRKADTSVVADEHFGLVSADRSADKQLLQ